MNDLYYWPTPNGHKITMFLEEAELDYAIHPVDISAGDQFKPEFLAISPNNRMPAIVDLKPSDGGKPISVFESGAILSYVADKTRVLLPSDLRERTRFLSGCSGKLAGSAPWPDRTTILGSMRPKRSPTQSNATSRRPIGSMAYLTVGSPGASSSPPTLTRLPI